jgi:hypothetical protein
MWFFTHTGNSFAKVDLAINPCCLEQFLLIRSKNFFSQRRVSVYISEEEWRKFIGKSKSFPFFVAVVVVGDISRKFERRILILLGLGVELRSTIGWLCRCWKILWGILGICVCETLSFTDNSHFDLYVCRMINENSTKWKQTRKTSKDIVLYLAFDVWIW